jgi:uncharacterized protein YjdB
MSIVIPVVDGSDGDIDSETYGFEFQIFTGATAVLSYNEASDEVTMGDGTITIAVAADDTADFATNTTLMFAARLYVPAGATVTLTEGTFSIKDNAIERTADVAVTGVTGLPAALEMTEGDIVQLAVNVAPALATDKRITWASDDTDVATVSTAGLVTAVLAGTCDITATSVDDGTKLDTCALTVVE